jgi:hypothetical protein
MLEVPKISAFVNASPRPTNVTPDRPIRMSGRRLNRLAKGASPTKLALLAYGLAKGKAPVLGFTYAQAAGLVGASIGYVGTVGRLTDAERLRLSRDELSLSRLHNRRRVPTDTEIDRLVATLGPERVLAALDRATTPPTAPHSHNGAAPHFHQEPQEG